MSASEFPSPARGGPMWKKFRDLEPDYDVVTTEQKMDDGGFDFNLEADTPILGWELEYDVLDETKAGILDDWRATTKGKNQSFTFTHPRTGVVYTGVRVLKYEQNHDSRHSVTQTRRITLIKYP